jgi:hypothetical protein
MNINMFEGARRIAKLVAVLWAVGWCIDAFTNSTYIHVYFRVDSPGSVPIRMEGQERGCNEDDATEYLSQRTNKGTDVSLTLCFKPFTSIDGRKLIPIRSDRQHKTREVYDALRNAETAGDADAAKKLAAYIQSEEFEFRLRAEREGEQPKANAGKYKFNPDEYLANIGTQHQADASKPNMLWGNEKYSTEVSNYTKRVASYFKLTKADEEWIDSKVWPARWEKIKVGALVIVGGVAFLWVFSWGVGWIVRGFAGIPTGHDRKPEDTPPPA